jgi:hypothetical protein
MLRILGTCAALALLIVMAFPFGKEAYHRYEVSKRLGPLMTDRDRADFQQWNGNAQDFARMLYERCQLQKGQDAQACDELRSAMR